ncbi:MAG TPA: 4Fe-4S binding protein, partial [Bradyrhizobium sp.]|nr:4Fe-4S binding protein [Bradyrhizobium sp.]
MALQHISPPAPTQNIKVDLSEADLVRRSASSVPQPARKLTSVAKLIDTSKCIGCKACESACLEWNNLREEVGFNHGVYDNPLDLTPESLTVMRFSEWINPETQNLEWLIRK